MTCQSCSQEQNRQDESIDSFERPIPAFERGICLVSPQKVRSIRYHYNLSVQEFALLLAQRVGKKVHQTTVQHWESGKLIPNGNALKALQELESAFQWPPSPFFEDLSALLKQHCGAQCVRNLAAHYSVQENALLEVAETIRTASRRYDHRVIAIAEQRDIFEALLRKVLDNDQLRGSLRDEIASVLARYEDFQNIDHGYPCLLEDAITFQEETVRLFSREMKGHRELLICDALARTLKADRSRLSATPSVEDSISDVSWASFAFQVKELTDGAREREACEKLDAYRRAKRLDETSKYLPEQLFTPSEVDWIEILEDLRELVDKKSYSDVEKSRSNLVAYFNKEGLVPAQEVSGVALDTAKNLGWASVSVVSSARIDVLHANANAPDWLAKHSGESVRVSLEDYETWWDFREIVELQPGKIGFRRSLPPARPVFF